MWLWAVGLLYVCVWVVRVCVLIVVRVGSVYMNVYRVELVGPPHGRRSLKGCVIHLYIMIYA